MKSALQIIAAFLVAAGCAVGDAGELPRRPFPGFALETFVGDSLSLADLRGKVVLVTIWTSWCPACRTELPVLDSLPGTLSHPDFAVIGINEDLKEDAGRGFARALGLRMPIPAGRGRLRESMGYTGIPYTALLDREGRVILEYYGWPGRKAFDEVVAGRAMAELRDGAR